ncbi:hypothetical protein NSQ26_14120 [Bacillus sp. FSL W7-1360]
MDKSEKKTPMEGVFLGRVNRAGDVVISDVLTSSDVAKHYDDFLKCEFRHKVRAINDLPDKHIKEGDTLYFDKEKEPLIESTVIVKIRNDGEGYVDNYTGQKYEACVCYIEKRKR